MLNISITFDYELFLGKNYISEDKVLFEPTQKILEMLSAENTKGTFFADVCSVFQHELYGQNTYCEGFIEQIKELTRKGQDVQLHIHSNWLRSTYSNNEWNITFDGYKIHDFGFNPEDKNSAFFIIQRSKTFLEKHLQSVNPNYKCMAYRAGGFCIRPESELIKALRANDIIIDSSVALRQKSLASIQDYDFCNAPDRLNWWFNSSDGLFVPVDKSSGELFEVAIGYGKNSIKKFLGIPLRELHVESRHGAGTGITIPNYSPNKIQQMYMSIRRRLFSDGILSLDSRGYKVLMRDLDVLYRKFDCDNTDHNVSIICHPKLASDETINNMKAFIRQVRLQEDRYSFVTMTDIYNSISGGADW